LWALTCGAVAAGADRAPARPVQAQVWGLGRVAALEHPDRWGGLIDLPPVLDERAAGRLCAVLSGTTGEDQAAIRGTGIWARRLGRAPRPRPRPGRGWVPRGSALITGGTGAIGAHAARWLAARGAPALILTSRSGPAAAGTAALAAELAAAGTAVTITACDTAQRGQLTGLLDQTATTGPPLTTVLHAAGVLDDGLVDGLGPDRLAGVLAAKAGGAALLDELTAGLDLDAFVLFSSVAAVFGGAGQGNYAAANAYLDALAQDRQARSLPAVSVAWGPWAGGGLAQASEAARQRQRRGPMPGLDPVLAVEALGQAVEDTAATVAVMDVDWARYCAVPGAAQAPFVRDLPETRQHAAASASGAAGAEQQAGALARRLAEAGRAGRDQMLLDLVRAEAAQILGHPSPGAIDAERPFNDMGFDSLTSLELSQHLSGATGLKLPASLLFDYPSPAVLAGHLQSRLFPATEDSGADADEAAIRAALASVPLAQFRAAGVLDILLKLANPHDGAEVETSAVDSRIDSIREMDAESLIRMALGDDSS
jgi:NAD(P)-dependent dehydrogenase (short-subunit alcohol dehydrogenase family)